MKKKDYNYIAAVEKAISKKYGVETVQDFRTSWPETREKDYLEQLRRRNKSKNKKPKKEKQQPGQVLNTPLPRTRKEERTCTTCKTYSFSPKDDLYMNRFKCCFRCYIEFVEYREEKWLSGKRPSKENINEALKRRKNNG